MDFRNVPQPWVMFLMYQCLIFSSNRHFNVLSGTFAGKSDILAVAQSEFDSATKILFIPPILWGDPTLKSIT
jgi:hypothetical protein